MERMCTVERAAPSNALNFTFALDGIEVLTVSCKPAEDGEPSQIGVWRKSADVKVEDDRLGGLLLSWVAE